jgi:hypothetical protein
MERRLKVSPARILQLEATGKRALTAPQGRHQIQTNKRSPTSFSTLSQIIITVDAGQRYEDLALNCQGQIFLSLPGYCRSAFLYFNPSEFQPFQREKHRHFTLPKFS